MLLVLDSQNSGKDDTNDAFGMLKTFVPLVFPVLLIVFFALALVILVIESQLLQLLALIYHVPGTLVKRAREST